MPSLTERVRDFSSTFADPTDSAVIHMRTLRMAIGYVGLALPFVLAIGENLRDALLPAASRRVDRALIETSISAYFHTGMREVFVGALCTIAVFLLCYKGYEKRDNFASNVAGFFVLLVALFPTAERSREAADTGARPPDSVTLFSGPGAPDPAWVGRVHLGSAALFFLTLAYISLCLFTRSDPRRVTARKRLRNRIYVVCGTAIAASIALIALGKLLLDESVEQRTSYVFWLETVSVIAFGISWLTKAEVILGDDYREWVRAIPPARDGMHRPADPGGSTHG